MTANQLVLVFSTATWMRTFFFRSKAAWFPVVSVCVMCVVLYKCWQQLEYVGSLLPTRKQVDEAGRVGFFTPGLYGARLVTAYGVSTLDSTLVDKIGAINGFAKAGRIATADRKLANYKRSFDSIGSFRRFSGFPIARRWFSRRRAPQSRYKNPPSEPK